MESMERKRELLKRLISFYRDYISGSAKAVDTLADIQEDFSDFYEIIDKVKSDPTLIDQVMAEMSEHDKETFLLILIKASMLGERMNKLFDLSVEEKRELAKDLREFSEFVDRTLTESAKERVKK